LDMKDMKTTKEFWPKERRDIAFMRSYNQKRGETRALAIVHTKPEGNVERR